MTQWNGVLLAHIKGQNLTKEILVKEVGLDQKKELPVFLFKRDFVFGLSQWNEYSYHSNEPLAGENLMDGKMKAPFCYPVLCVVSGSKMILLANRKKILRQVISRVLNVRIFPNLKNVEINLEELIKECCQDQATFRITSLNGKFSGRDSAIKSISFHGNNLTDSSIFELNKSYFDFFSCGLARKSFDGLPRISFDRPNEITRLGNNGSISTSINSRHEAQEFLKVIQYVISKRMVDDWVPGVEF